MKARTKKYINMEEKYDKIKELIDVFFTQIEERRLLKYLNCISFCNNISGYACYNLSSKKVKYNIDGIYDETCSFDHYIFKRVLLHEIRHSEQRKIIDNKVSYIDNMFFEALQYKNLFESKFIATEIDADINSFLYMILCSDNDEEFYKCMVRLYNMLLKKYSNYIPLKEFYNQLGRLSNYYSYLDKIVSNYIRLQTGLELNENLLYEIENNFYNPNNFKKIILKRYLF